jgi:toxin ParE1/3/4
MKIVLLAPAQAELDEAADYYADRASPRIAQAFLDDFEHARNRLAEFPEIGKSISKRLRILSFRHFPYSVIYRLLADTLVIQAIAHQRRRPGYWRGQR